MSNEDPVQLVDLADLSSECREAVLHKFIVDVYEPAFPRPELRDDPDVWRALLSDQAPPPSPLLTIILARQVESGFVAGGIVAEYFRRAGSGLITYLAVSPSFRRQGLARRLLDAAVEKLDSLAKDAGVPDPLIFGEIEASNLDPDDQIVALQRMDALGSLGFMTSDLPYLQPPLRAGDAPAPGLHLLVLATSRGIDRKLPAFRISAFLREFYASLPTDNQAEAALSAMLRWLEDRDLVELKPLGSASSQEEVVGSRTRGSR